MTPRPPTPPLFPYTTLFRSVSRRVRDSGEAGRRCAADAVGARAARDEPQPRQLVRALRAGRVDAAQGEDRKSTRLNSSHITISYAVFCLKKKKNNLQHKNTM